MIDRKYSTSNDTLPSRSRQPPKFCTLPTQTPPSPQDKINLFQVETIPIFFIHIARRQSICDTFVPFNPKDVDPVLERQWLSIFVCASAGRPTYRNHIDESRSSICLGNSICLFLKLFCIV
jgi:hypothetical protein